MDCNVCLREIPKHLEARIEESRKLNNGRPKNAICLKCTCMLLLSLFGKGESHPSKIETLLPDYMA